MKFLEEIKKKDIFGKTCILRVDFNIKNKDLRNSIKNNHPRISNALLTIKFLIKNGAKVVILSHRGRPEQKSKLQSKIQNNLSLEPFVKIFSKLLKKSIKFINFADLRNFKFVKEKIENSKKGSLFLLENLRFFPEEQKNNKNFAKQLASLGDFYVNDAFSVSHRKNASVVAITEFLPSYVGLSLRKEIDNLSQAIKKPKRPLVVILGGVKVIDKIRIINNLAKKADCFLIGGGVANTFFVAENLLLGNSLYDKKMVPLARRLLKTLNKPQSKTLGLGRDKIILPIDSAIKDEKILDIGLETVKMYENIIKKAKTIIWNGPMGLIEEKSFAYGTEKIIKAISKSRAFSIIGGGETVLMIGSLKIKNSRMFLSTGGGAMLDFLAGKKMPGIEALK
ncbi:phosphoglycerate kinase [Candidatus Wolfebacteria bacterium]|nr:phosphoglycerate kinase [Candidatus Wolfebacteria bacterium]